MESTILYEVVCMLLRLDKEADEYGLEAINSVLLFKGLLEEEVSPMAELILKQLDGYGYRELLYNCYELLESSYSRRKKKEKEFCYVQIPVPEEEPLIINFEMELNGFVYNLRQTDKVLNFEEVTRCFVNALPNKIIGILRGVGINIKQLKGNDSKAKTDLTETSTQKETSTQFVIPNELKSFVRNLNEKFEKEECVISGRDKECELLWQTLQKKTKRNAILIGEPGVGKTSIVEKITYDIVTGNCPEEFKNMTVLSLDVTSSIAGTMYRGQAEERYAALSKFLEGRSDVILFIDEIHLIKGAGATREGEADLANAIKPILAGSNVRVIGGTTIREYEAYFSKDGAIKRRFRPIEVKEPKMDEVYPMLQKSIDSLSKYHGVEIDRAMVDYIILNSACFNYETKNPDRTKDLIDLSMVIAKQKGKAKVDEECVRTNFKYNLENFEKMSKEDKLSVAYHEAGHAIVSKCSGLLKDQKVIAISILPTDEYLGVTVYDDTEEYVNPTYEFFIDRIASDLAGRMAEKLYTKTLSSGASVDLKNATAYATQVVTKYGMSELGVNRSYEEEIMNERLSGSVNKAIDKIINEATARAETILNDNIEVLKKLVEMLIEKGIVTGKEFEELFAVKQIS